MIVEILRGLPGSGKSSYAQGLGGVVYSADAFFMRDGVYIFDPSKIGDAHKSCFSAYLARFSNPGRDLIIVDNTNIHASEIAPYVAVANAYNVEVKVITFMCDPFVAYKRQTHGVPGSVFMSMYQSLLTERLHPYWKHEIRFMEGCV